MRQEYKKEKIFIKKKFPLFKKIPFLKILTLKPKNLLSILIIPEMYSIVM